MNCTDKERESCQVEKRGCEGCFYNSDKNVANIEDDVKVLTEENSAYKKEQAMSHILEVVKQKDRRIKEVEAKLEEANKQLDLDYVDKNYIPVKKVIDKIDELEEKMGYEDNEKVLVYLHKQRKVLKELLEGK